MATTQAHCNRCGGHRNHETLSPHKTTWNAKYESVTGSDTYETLNCRVATEVEKVSMREYPASSVGLNSAKQLIIYGVRAVTK